MIKKYSTYIDKEDAESVIKKLKGFENDLSELFSNHNLNLRINSGRRNMLLSQAQEAFFSNALREKGFDSIHDGRTGEADIVINDLEKELECKLTSGSGNSWPLQCDYATLSRKGKLDFLYMLCNKEFNEFAILLFENLTIDDFFFPSPGSRQKSRMNKANAMKKCHTILGEVNNKNKKMIDKYCSDIEELELKASKRLSSLENKITLSTTPKNLKNTSRVYENEKKRFEKKRSNLFSKLGYWKKNKPVYEIRLEKI